MTRTLSKVIGVLFVCGLAVVVTGYGIPFDTGPPLALSNDRTPVENTQSPPNDSPPTATEELRFSIGDIETCGRTCRNVPTTLTNTRAMPVHEVVVKTTIAAGNVSIWTERTAIGRLGAGESVTTTIHIDIGVRGGLAIKANNGYVTIRTVITTADHRRVITDRRKVT